MPLKCSSVDCANFELAEDSQLAFYQDLNNGGWNLALAPEYVIPESELPPNIRLVETGDLRFPYNAVCNKCLVKIGNVNEICGFRQFTVNFNGKKVALVRTRYDKASGAQKWSKIISGFPHIRQLTATVEDSVSLVGSDTVLFHGVKELDEMIDVGNAVARLSKLYPRNYQWRSYFFACFKNVLLCLPTGMGKTLISTMLMKAYHQRNANQGQTFVVPTVVLVEQQAAVVERNTGLKVMRRSGEQNNRTEWTSNEICVCTPAMLLNGIKMKMVDLSQQCLLIFDEVHEAGSPLSSYGLLLPYILKCPASQRPRVLGLSASPSSSNASNIRESISSLCDKLLAVPYTPLIDDTSEVVKSVNCEFVGIYKSVFELRYESFIIKSLEKLSTFHQFFERNWIPIPFNSPTQIKIDLVVKSLSHAKLMAQHMADMALFELTQWMRKWIDSLDLLQIFGPRKLIDFIRADLQFVIRNDSLKKISPVLASFVTQMQSEIESLVSGNAIEENSPKVDELLRRLRAHLNDDERILIFVNRRNTAERLCRKLKYEAELVAMNPSFVVGSSGTNFPKELQQSILEMFSRGECRILISTSVLEQGIDVAACGLVICFDGIKSVKSTIQSRGRARKDLANFVVFVASDEQRKANELNQMEISMDYAIRQLMVEYKSAFDPYVNQEIEKFLDSDRLIVNDTAYSDDDEEADDDELLMQNDRNVLHFRFFNFVNSRHLIESLVDHIENCIASRVERVRVRSGLIYAQIAVTDIAIDSKVIREVSTFATNRKSSRLRSWFDVSYRTSKSDDERETNNGFNGLEFEELRGFYFKDFLTVCYDSNCIWNGKFQFIIRNNEIVLSASKTCQFIIRAMDIDGPILINDCNQCFEIFLCLRIPPSYFTGNELDHFDFDNNSFNLSLKRSGAVPSDISWSIRTACQSLNIQINNVCNLRQTSVVEGHCHLNSSVDFMRDYLIKTWQSTHAAVLPTHLPPSILTQLHGCESISDLMLFLNNTKPIRFHSLRIDQIANVKLPFADCNPQPENYALIGRVKVTPYRYIFCGLEPVPINRVYRYFPNPDHFLMVSFCDEYGGNPWRSEKVCSNFMRVLNEGIRVGNANFSFLGCSNSQLREGRCWFSSLDRQTVYDKIGEFPDSWSVGRKLTRIALAFAASVATVPLDHGRYLKTVAPDVEIGGINFSDGIGRASRDLFKEVTKMIGISESTSALQIRVGGVKGVVSVYDQEEDVVFRKSMKKFESEHNRLEVLNYSRSIKLCLNRHVILLLSSFGVPDNVFLDMQHNVLMENVDILADDNSSFAFVKSHSNIFDWHLFPREHLIREPFFRHLLFSNFNNMIAGITNHSHIPVADGRVLMGVLDETGTLEYGEIYANIVEEGNDEFELEGKVVVFRNPCVLPSDIRVLNACNRSDATVRLKKLYQNCLVIPSKGPDSHARECAGGDLDGDLYYVIWDKDLLPKNVKVPGEKIVEVFTEEKKAPFTGDSSLASIIQFYCDYVSKNQLGVIANAHLAVSDSLGMRHPQSIQLARYVAAETDAPKKGLTIGKIDSKLLPASYPDYMQKMDKPMYRSSTVLGKLYRESKPIFEIFLEKRVSAAPVSKFQFTGDTKSIENMYEMYAFEVKTLLQRFDLQSEVDLFSGTPMWREDYMSTHKQQHQLRETLIDNVRQFWKKWNVRFEKWRAHCGNDQQKILEWHSKPKSSPWPLHSFSFLAMPFIRFDSSCTEKTISHKIFESTKRWVQKNKMRWLSEWRVRYNIGQIIVQQLERIECHYYGSSMLGLSEEFSDIDFYTSEDDFVKLRTLLKCLDENAMDMTKPHACVTLSINSLNIDVTNFMGGVSKTYALAAVFDARPTYWSALRVLTEWARTVRIVKSCGSQGIMTVVSFCHLFIQFATASASEHSSDAKPYTLIRFGHWMEAVQHSVCGSLIYDFLTFLAGRKNRDSIAAAVDPFNGEPLIKSDLIGELCTHGEHALMLLTVHDGDVRKLFQFCTKKRLFRLDKHYLDPKNATDERKRQCLREIVTICNSTKTLHLLFELVERNGLFYVEVIGDYKYLPDVEKGIHSIHCKVINTRIRAGTLRHTTFHVANSTVIVTEFGNGSLTEVSFETYNGDLYTARHTGFWKSRLTCRSANPNHNWRTSEYTRYQAQFMGQMRLFREKREINFRNSKIRRFFSDMLCNIRCGNHYFFNVPETLHNSFETLTLQTVEEKVSHLEEALVLEQQGNINNNLQDSLTLIKGSAKIDDKKPLMLMPLTEMKNRWTGGKKANNKDAISSTMDSKTNGIRHSFYPIWRMGLDGAREFAAQHGFKEVRSGADDSDAFYTTISVFWCQRELVIKCDKNGIIIEIRHRSTRWLSASFHNSRNEGGCDVRSYLECRAVLHDDESCIETIVEYMRGRSIYTESFVKQFKKNWEDAEDGESFSPRPLIPDIFQLNWRFRSMRLAASVLKFVNSDNDVLWLHNINDGIFQFQKSEFEWFPNHFEFELQLCMDQLTDEELCRKSYVYSLDLFDYLKRSAALKKQ